MKELTCISKYLELVVTVSHIVRSRFTPHSLVLFLSTSPPSPPLLSFPFSLSLNPLSLSNVAGEPLCRRRQRGSQSRDPPARRRSSSTSQNLHQSKALTPPTITVFSPCSRRETIGDIPMSFHGRLSISVLVASAVAASFPAVTYTCTSK